MEVRRKALGGCLPPAVGHPLSVFHGVGFAKASQRIQYEVRLSAEAQKQHRSVNNLVEVFLLESLYREPNATTLAAMAEVKSGAELDELTDENIDNLEDYIKSL